MNSEPQCGLGTTLRVDSAEPCKDQNEKHDMHASGHIPLEHLA